MSYARAATFNGKSGDPIAPFAVLSLMCFALGAAVLSLMMWKADKLVALGLVGRLYYVVLLPLGLSVSAFLFGVLQSYATYSGQQLGGKLVLGGPIVGFLLVVLLGFILVPDPSTFPLTVFVHGPTGPQEVVLRNSGEVFMDLGGERRHLPIGDQGQAYFPAIPSSFRGQQVPVWIDSEKFESIDPGKKLKLDGPSIYLEVHRKAGHIYGRIESADSSCLSQAQIYLGILSTRADPNSGQFDLTIPGDQMGVDMELQATAPGCISGRYKVVPNSNGVVITLQKLQNPRR